MSKDLVAPTVQINKVGIPVIVSNKGEEVSIYTSPFNMRIVHPSSITNNESLLPHLGKFYFQEIDVSTEELILVPLSEGTIHRSLFPDNFNGSTGNNEPLCRSLDGLTPDSRIEAPISLQCAHINPDSGNIQVVCPMAMWENNRPSKCRMSKLIPFYDCAAQIPIYWELKGVALSAYNKALREWNKQVNINIYRGLSTDNLVLQVTLANKGTYFEPVFKYITYEGVSDVRNVIQYYKGLFIRQEDDSTVEVDEVDTVAGELASSSVNSTVTPEATESATSIEDDVEDMGPTTENESNSAAADEAEAVNTANNKRKKKSTASEEDVDFEVE